MTSTTPGTSPDFSVGDSVRVVARDAIGHCRAPRFIRGKTGIIANIQGTFRDPERLAYHLPGLPALTLYKVRFNQRDLWPEYSGPAHDTLEVDVYANWLDAASSTNA